MAILKTISPAEATGKLAEIYKEIIQNLGMVPQAFQLYSASPVIFEHQMNYVKYYMTHQTLSGKLTAYTRLLISTQHTCAYCVNMNTGFLMHMGVSIEDILAAKANPENTNLDAKEKAMLLFTLKVVNNSTEVEEADLQKLRDLGWSDGEILDGSYHASAQLGFDALLNAFKVEDDRPM